VTAKHFDVIVLGRSIGALTAAALLARRDFTVLVLGQGERASTYGQGRRVLLRRAFTMLAASSPTWRKVVVELAQSQTWKRRVVPASPMMQVLKPRRRIDVPPDMALFGREIDREYPELRRLVDELYGDLARVNAVADEAFEHDAVWPPGTFWERRETNRWASLLPHARAEPDADLLAEFPRGHPFRQIVTASVLFATHLSSLPPPFAVARLHGAWTRGVDTLARGEEELEEFLVDRITAHGGRCLFEDRAAAIHVRRGSSSGVLIDGDAAPTGASFVLSDLDGEALAALAGGEGIHKRAQREWPRITSSAGRFVVSLVVRREGLPEPLGPEAFVLPGDRPLVRGRAATSGRSAPPAQRPTVHLQRVGRTSSSMGLRPIPRRVRRRGAARRRDPPPRPRPARPRGRAAGRAHDAGRRAAVPGAAPRRGRLGARRAPGVGLGGRPAPLNRSGHAPRRLGRARADAPPARGRPAGLPGPGRRAHPRPHRAHPAPRPQRPAGPRPGGRAPRRLGRRAPRHPDRPPQGADAPGHVEQGRDRLASRLTIRLVPRDPRVSTANLAARLQKSAEGR
jgi:phytoene dehydrogenase-like protein